MTEERITESTDADGNTHTRTTIITDEPRKGGGSGWLIGVLILVAIIVGVVLFTQLGGAEMAKDQAIADAAQDVGDAAQKAGDAVQDVADEVTDGE